MAEDWRDANREELEARLKDALAMQASYLQSNPVPCLCCGAEGLLYVYSHLFFEDEEIRILELPKGTVRAVAFTLCEKCRDPYPSNIELALKTKASVDRGRVKVNVRQEFN